MNAPLLPALPGYDDPQLIAHGTTALVFRAIQTRLSRPVAIKVITADTSSGSVPVNVERELATTVALSSQPHIVSIIDTGVTEDDRRYIVMEYCEGGSYAQILRQRGPLPVDDVVEVGIKIGQALHAAHQVGIVHRDVKPSNVLRSRFGPALTDFGIARAPDELGSTLTREMMTPHHASPEALLHQAQSGPSDIYSLASTMWTLLVGHPPFVDPANPARDMYLFRDRVLHDPLPPMPREDVPAWLVAELRRAMAKLPSQRHGTALEFSEALQRGALGIEQSPGPVTPATPGTGAGPLAAEGSSSGGRTHVPGLPAQAWPAAPAPAMHDARLASIAETPVSPPTAPGPASAPAVAPPPVPSATAAPPQTAPHQTAPPHAVPAPPPPPPPAAPQAAPPQAAPPRAAPLHAVPAPPPPPHPLAASAGPAVEDGPIYQPRSAPSTVRPAPATHPLGGSERPSTRPAEDGGWLGPRPGDLPTNAWPEVDLQPVHPRPHRGAGVTAPSGGRRGGLLAVLVGVAVIAVVSGVLLYLRSGQDTPTVPADETEAIPSLTALPSVITPGTEGAPTDVKIEDDNGTSVTLTWTDPAGGSQSYLAVAYLSQSDDPLEYKQVPSGAEQMSVTFTGLEADENYCFTIGVVYSIYEVSAADPVCTHR